MLAGLPADAAVAAIAFVGTNIDNAVVTTTMVAAAPAERSRRIAVGQIIGFGLLVAASAGTALALFEFSSRVIGLLGLVPLALGLRGFWLLRHHEHRTRAERRAVGSGLVTAVLVTVAAGGDNLAVYIPIFRVAGAVNITTITVVFFVGELLLTLLVVRAGRHPKIRQAMTRTGVVATPLLYVAVGLVVLVRAGTLHFIG